MGFLHSVSSSIDIEGRFVFLTFPDIYELDTFIFPTELSDNDYEQLGLVIKVLDEGVQKMLDCKYIFQIRNDTKVLMMAFYLEGKPLFLLPHRPTPGV